MPFQVRPLHAVTGLVFALTVGRALVPAHAAAAPSPTEVEFFENRVRPVLVEQCYKCHSAKSEKLKGGLRLDSRADLLKGGDTGPAVVPGKPEDSLLIKAVHSVPGSDLEMPPKKKLPAGAIADLTAWVKAGAPWPEEAAPAAGVVKEKPDFDKARKEHWAFQPLGRPAAPRVKDARWAKTPIDAFVLAKIEEKGLTAAPPAEKRTLLRRVYLDLIGLPPTPEEQQAFLDDPLPGGLAKVVDDLLARPQYGERWGRHWLDVVRYAETQGYERDEPKPYTWRFRDYVIKSFNEDKPYDRFLTEQLAGDEIDGGTAPADVQVATTFLRLGTFDTIAADGKLARYDTLDDVVGTTTAAFLGQSLRCARCHDHKFEPLAQEDYYRILGVFEPIGGDFKAKEVLVGGPEELKGYQEAAAKQDAFRIAVLDRLGAGHFSEADKSRRSDKKANVSSELLAALKKPAANRDAKEKELVERGRRKLAEELRRLGTAEDKAEDDRIQKELDGIGAGQGSRALLAYVPKETSRNPGPAKLFIRGDCNKPGKDVPVGIPTLWDAGGDVPAPTPTATTSGRRLWLAKWMTGPQGTPLVARVMANRIWQYHFGRGIVATPNDFGLHGDRPSHPELLDYLAGELVSNGWKLKQLHRQIILSSVYQTTAAHEQEAATDPENKLLWHWPTRRLEAEAIRDSILAVSGRLNPESYGPPIFPPLAQKVVGDSAGADWGQSDERASSRRSVYVFQKRSIPLPELDILGMPDSNASTDQRPVYTTALQSLLLLNSKFAFEQATALAERVKRDAGDDPAAQVRRAFELALCRPPNAGELEGCVGFLAATPGQTEGKKAVVPPLVSFCLVLLNTNEFQYLN